MIHEILVLHHSHLDIGYTHSQQVLMELQGDYLDQALDFLDRTRDWEGPERPKWTCEVTQPVLDWLETASASDEDRFRQYVSQGRIGISAMQYNTTPLCNREQLVRQLSPTRELEARLGISINTVNQHDVNGVPWTLADLMIDSGMELLTMAINTHLGRPVAGRPGIFRWQAPSGRDLLVMNGNHYTMFDQLLNSWDYSLARMREGFNVYCRHLESLDNSHDFLYLTTTCSPQMWDNSPPNLKVAELIRAWNEKADKPVIRYVTPADLLERIKQIPTGQLPVMSGDWTDYWNFGCASTAHETAMNQGTKPILRAGEFLNALSPEGTGAPRRRRALVRAWENLNRYDEHTWCYYDTDPNHQMLQSTLHVQLNHAYEAREAAGYALISALEDLVDNPMQSERCQTVLFANLLNHPQTLYPEIPTAWLKDCRQLRCNRFQHGGGIDIGLERQLCEPVELAPFSWKRIALADLTPCTNRTDIAHGDTKQEVDRKALNGDGTVREQEGYSWIESPFHRIEYDTTTARILRLYDKASDWEVLSSSGDVDFFDFVREHPDALLNGARTSFYKRDLDKEKMDVSCWQPDLKMIHEKALRPLGCRLEETARSRTLIRTFEAPGVTDLEQRITLFADSPGIDLHVSFHKEVHNDPEAIYFVFPLNLGENWRSHFDSAGTTVELDAEQLPGACRDWFTVESFAAVHQGDRCFSLITPDAPMIMAGGFNFGRRSDAIPRPAHPLLLSWVCNNYWDTNFPQSQPGPKAFRYTVLTTPGYDAQTVRRHADTRLYPVLMHPCAEDTENREGSFLQVNGAEVLAVRKSRDNQGVIVSLQNTADQEKTAWVRLGLPVLQAFACDPLESLQQELESTDNAFEISIPPRCSQSLKLIIQPANPQPLKWS